VKETADFVVLPICPKGLRCAVRCIEFIEQWNGPQSGCFWKGRSRVKRNFHVRFLAECGRAKRLRLPGTALQPLELRCYSN
jgi:hypothetical protein